MEKDWPKRPSDCQLQEARKKTLIGPSLLWQRQSVSQHTWCLQGPRKPSSCATFTLSSHWGRAATGKKSLSSRCTGSLQLCLTLCDPVDCGLPGFCVGGSPGKNTGVYWPILVAISFKSTIFPAALADNSRVPAAARTPVTQAPTSPPHLALTEANPSPPGQPQEQTPVDNPHAEVEIKPQLKPRGSVSKEEDPKPSHQLYKLQIKST